MARAQPVSCYIPSQQGDLIVPIPSPNPHLQRQLEAKLKDTFENGHLLPDAILHANPLARASAAMDIAARHFGAVAQSAISKDLVTYLEELQRWKQQPSLRIVVNWYNEDLQWLATLCYLLKAVPRIAITIFAKGPSQELAPTLLAELLRSNTEVTLEPGANVGREGHSYLTFMLYHAHQLADINVFLQGGMETSLARVVDAVQAQYSHLVRQRAANSGDFVLQAIDIQSYSSLCPLFSPSKVATLAQQAASQAGLLHELHFVNLGLELPTLYYYQANRLLGDVATREYCALYQMLWPRADADACKHVIHTYRGEFVATHAAITRLLDRHGPELVEIWRRLGESNSPLLGHHLERRWVSLFLGPVQVKHCYYDSDWRGLKPKHMRGYRHD